MYPSDKPEPKGNTMKNFERDIDLQCKLIENMHEIVCNMNNECAYELWIMTYPDGADEEEVREMAEMDNGEYFDEIAAAFFRVCKAYGKDGMSTLKYIG